MSANEAVTKRITDAVVVLDVTFHRPSLYRKGDISLVETDADKGQLHLTKAIVDTKEYSDVMSVAWETRAWIEKRALPSPLKRGTHLVPIALVDAICDYLDAQDAKYKERVEKFLSCYPARVEEAAKRLGNQFDRQNYPRAEALRAAFWIERRLLDFGVPSKEKIGLEIWKQERDRAESTWKAAMEEVRSAMRTAFRDLCAKLAERLEDGPDGTKKRLHESAIEKLTEFLELFGARNITGDAELKRLADNAKDVLAGRTVDDLRQSESIRSLVGTEMARVTAAASKLVVDAPKRRITFDD